MRFSPLALFFAALCFVPTHASAQDAKAQDLPPREILDQIIRQLPKPLPPAKISFEPQASAGADEACRMQNFQMTLARESGGAANRYSVLLDPQPSGSAAPRQLLAVITRLAVDADGAERAYHPEDPHGKGVCREERDAAGRSVLNGICALDNFNPSGIRLYRDAQRARLLNPDKPAPKDDTPNLAALWKDMWPLIRDRKIKAYDLKAAVAGAPAGYNLFYWKERKLTALTKRAIIPSTNDGYPCVRGAESRHPGYFIAATTLTKPSAERADGCAPGRYIDASEVPFFVLPGGDFGHIEIGDVVIGFFKSGAVERIAFGVAGDAGPIEQFGEGSIAFNQALRGKAGEPVMNVQEVNNLDIDSSFLKEQGATLAILVLGGTKKRLGGNYARENVERIAREELVRWNGGGERLTARLNACLAKAKPVQ